MASVASQDDVLAFRESAQKNFPPGCYIKIVKHSIGDQFYSNIWLQQSPEDKDSAEYTAGTGPALIVASLRNDQHQGIGAWLLLMFSDGKVGWTNEFEALEVLTLTRT